MGELFENKVSKTMLMTLQAKALEGSQKNRLFMDQKAEEIMMQVPLMVNVLLLHTPLNLLFHLNFP